jgi:hypothetical protein
MNLKDEIGNNAGKVWSTISKINNASFTKLRAETDLKDNEMYEAIGWLAREDKIKREGRIYQLDSTNLTPEIGGNAGKIYKILQEKKELTLNDLMKSGKMNKKEVWTAIGWLVKEDKVASDESGRFTLK